MGTDNVTDITVFEKTVGPQYNPATGLGNWDSARTPVDRIVLHTMVGSADSAHTRFNNPTSNVSAHYGIRLDGSIWHWVDDNNVAYHSGVYAMNQRSLGIEHEDNGDYNGPRTEALYMASGALVRERCLHFGIPIDREHILKHNDVYATGCPDGLDVNKIIAYAQTPPTLPVTDPIVSLPASKHDELVAKATSFDTIATYFEHSLFKPLTVNDGSVVVDYIKSALSASQRPVDAQILPSTTSSVIPPSSPVIPTITVSSTPSSPVLNTAQVASNTAPERPAFYQEDMRVLLKRLFTYLLTF